MMRHIVLPIALEGVGSLLLVAAFALIFRAYKRSHPDESVGLDILDDSTIAFEVGGRLRGRRPRGVYPRSLIVRRDGSVRSHRLTLHEPITPRRIGSEFAMAIGSLRAGAR